MQNFKISPVLMIFLSLFVASCLTIISLPTTLDWFHPPWVEIVLCFWILYLPQRFNVIYAWLIGLLMDALLSTTLGLHALAFVLMAYVIKKLYQQIRMFPRWQQGLSICLLLLIYRIILFWILTIVGQKPVLSFFWFPPLLSLLCWPLIASFLKPYARYLE